MHILQCISTEYRQAPGKAFILHLHLKWSNLLLAKVFNRAMEPVIALRVDRNLYLYFNNILK